MGITPLTRGRLPKGDTLTPCRSGTDMSEMLLSLSDRSLMEHLNSSGDIGWPCSVPQRM